MVEWKRQRIERSYRSGEGREAIHGGLSDTLLRLIREEPLRERTVLDVGCGNGRLTFALAEEVGRIIGIDPMAAKDGTDSPMRPPWAVFFLEDQCPPPLCWLQK